MTPEFLNEHFDPKKIRKTLDRVNHRWKERFDALQYKKVYGETPMQFMNALRGFLGLSPIIEESKRKKK